MIVLVEGIIGSGKTCVLAKFAKYAYDEGKKVYSNLALKFPYEKFDLHILAEKCGNFDDLYNCAIVLDEPYSWLDSRMSMSKVNKLFTYFTAQSRMRNNDIIVSAENIAYLDIRFRRAITIRVMPRVLKDRKRISLRFIDLRTGETVRTHLNIKECRELLAEEAAESDRIEKVKLVLSEASQLKSKPMKIKGSKNV
jgi:hypothetical protein